MDEIEIKAFKEFENVGDEKLFPNHTDKDIWVAGFKAGYLKAVQEVVTTELKKKL